MPKKVDHHSRRATIAEAVWDLMSREGIEAVSMRRVAAQAEISLGQLQHYFASKEELLNFAFELVTERVAYRARTRQNPVRDEGPTPRDVVRNALIEMLPLDEERTRDAGVWIALLARNAANHHGYHLVRKFAQFDLVKLIGDQVRRGQRAGTVSVHIEPLLVGPLLVSAVNGLILHVLCGLLFPHDAEQALDAYLDTLFSG
jgi:AcrR family transcriptional regulator